MIQDNGGITIFLEATGIAFRNTYVINVAFLFQTGINKNFVQRNAEPNPKKAFLERLVYQNLALGVKKNLPQRRYPNQRNVVQKGVLTILATPNAEEWAV